MKLVYIKWQDAVSNSGWFSENETGQWTETDNFCIVEQVGWVFKETPKYICLIGRITLNVPTYDCVKYGMLQKIPKTWILKRRTLKV